MGFRFPRESRDAAWCPYWPRTAEWPVFRPMPAGRSGRRSRSGRGGKTSSKSATWTPSRSFSTGGSSIHNVERPHDYPEYELYDHAKDPLDQKDLASEKPEMVERLATQLERWHEWALAARLPSDAEATEALPAEELERLRSLGYVQ